MRRRLATTASAITLLVSSSAASQVARPTPVVVRPDVTGSTSAPPAPRKSSSVCDEIGPAYDEMGKNLEQMYARLIAEAMNQRVKILEELPASAQRDAEVAALDQEIEELLKDRDKALVDLARSRTKAIADCEKMVAEQAKTCAERRRAVVTVVEGRRAGTTVRAIPPTKGVRVVDAAEALFVPATARRLERGRAAAALAALEVAGGIVVLKTSGPLSAEARKAILERGWRIANADEDPAAVACRP